MPWIKTVPYEEAEGLLKELYDGGGGPSAAQGAVSAIRSVQSLNPALLEKWRALSQVVLYGPSGVSRVQREMIATVVSALNACEY